MSNLDLSPAAYSVLLHGLDPKASVKQKGDGLACHLPGLGLEIDLESAALAGALSIFGLHVQVQRLALRDGCIAVEFELANI